MSTDLFLSGAHPRLSVNGMCMASWDLRQTIDAYRSLNVTRSVFPLVRIEESWDRDLGRLKESGLDIAMTIATKAFDLADPATWADARARIDRAVEATAELHASVLYVTTGPSRGLTTDGACARFAKAIGPSLVSARARRVELAVENNNCMTRDFGCVQSLRDTIQLASEVDMSIVVELSNCWMERDLPAIFRAGVERFALVQVSDFVIGTATRVNRRVPGDGDMPLEYLVTELMEAGYTGLFDLEIMGPSIEEEGYLNATRRGIDYMTELLDRVGV